MLLAADGPSFTGTALGITALITFVIAYAMVVTEDIIKLRKSKPVIFAAGAIWVFVAFAFTDWVHSDAFDLEWLRHHVHDPELELDNAGEAMGAMVGHHVKDFAELFLFLTVAMTYISAIAEKIGRASCRERV